MGGIMSLQVPRPIDPSLHPLATGNYRIATPAIQAFYELVGDVCTTGSWVH
jgi:hypothetical protein